MGRLSTTECTYLPTYLYCSRCLNSAYLFSWKSMGLCYANPPFSQLAKVLTKIALEAARVVLCTLDWGTTGEHAY